VHEWLLAAPIRFTVAPERRFGADIEQWVATEPLAVAAECLEVATECFDVATKRFADAVLRKLFSSVKSVA
jgi:hypothetical protein